MFLSSYCSDLSTIQKFTFSDVRYSDPIFNSNKQVILLYNRSRVRMLKLDFAIKYILF